MSNLFHPFITSQAVQPNLFTRRPPDVLWMSIVLLYLPGYEAEANRMRLLLEHHLLQNIRLFQPDDQVRAPIFTSLEMPSYLVDRLTPDRRKWMVNGVHLQAGYYDAPGTRGIHTSLAVGMTLYDHSVQVTGLEDPANHPALHGTIEEIVAAEHAIGNHYRSGLAWLCQNLLSHRTEILVRAHAVLHGQDPEKDFSQFQAGGRKYFL